MASSGGLLFVLNKYSKLRPVRYNTSPSFGHVTFSLFLGHGWVWCHVIIQRGLSPQLIKTLIILIKY